jgi:hypothetical protein
MESFAKKIGPWIPLLIAAGYFIFLIATWAKMSQQMAVQLKTPPVKEAKTDDTGAS